MRFLFGNRGPVRFRKGGATTEFGARMKPTKQYPEGRLNKDDEGALSIAVIGDPQRKVIIIEFGTSVTWIGLGPSHARHLASVLMAKADQMEDVTTEGMEH